MGKSYRLPQVMMKIKVVGKGRTLHCRLSGYSRWGRTVITSSVEGSNVRAVSVSSLGVMANHPSVGHPSSTGLLGRIVFHAKGMRGRDLTVGDSLILLSSIPFLSQPRLSPDLTAVSSHRSYRTSSVVLPALDRAGHHERVRRSS